MHPKQHVHVDRKKAGENKTQIKEIVLVPFKVVEVAEPKDGPTFQFLSGEDHRKYIQSFSSDILMFVPHKTSGLILKGMQIPYFVFTCPSERPV